MKTEKLTPLMQQYWQVKTLHTDKILLFRMGDFFEMFYDDAEVAAPILGIALTSRNKNSAEQTPMCGVPAHSIGPQINKLLQAGQKIAICDQLEDASQAKGLVRRGITRILTPGIVYDPDTLAEAQSNYLVAFNSKKISFVDTSSLEAFSFEVPNLDRALEILKIHNPSEVVLSSKQKQDHHENLNILSQSICDLSSNLDEADPELRLKTYLMQMQASLEVQELEFENRELQSRMRLSPTVIKSLEIFENIRGDASSSLFTAICRTKTSSGARLLKNALRFPLTDLNQINKRLDLVELWKLSPDLKDIRKVLSRLRDVERALSKISSPNVNPRDLLSLSESLACGLEVNQFVSQNDSKNLMMSIFQSLQPKFNLESCSHIAREVLELIFNSIEPDAPVQLKNSNVIKKGVSVALDEWIELSENAQKLLMELEAREKEATQIPSLKLKYNHIFGYYLEVTNTHKDKVPLNRYQRKQTLAGAERFITEELLELESKILSSQSKRQSLELEIFEQIKSNVLKKSQELLSLARFWAHIDLITSFAALAIEQDYVRPTFLPGATSNLRIEDSRHPVVEQKLKVPFKANTIELAQNECMLLTGPNMAGKSTLMRQVALCSVMAQMGSFVAASLAELPVFDQIFTRIGAHDDLSQGLSTFMLEMQETSEIMKHVTSQSLVILDEIGRGTSTYDGMSLAQAILEHILVHTKSKCFFATHYHELSRLSLQYSNLKNAHMRVLDSGAEIKFLHTLSLGPANKSYGIHVAKLAGLNNQITKRAEKILQEIQNSSLTQNSIHSNQMCFSLADSITHISSKQDPEALDRVEQIANRWDELDEKNLKDFFSDLSNLPIEQINPIMALVKLSEIQKKIAGPEFEKFFKDN